MKFVYDNSGRFWHGLPARDLDDAQLDKAQKTTLALAVAANAYAPLKEASDDGNKGSDSRTK
jgi:hypothetical protein